MLASDPPSLPSGDTQPVPGLDGIYVLSVKSFTDRIAHIRKELGAQHLDFEFVFDHDAAELDPAVLARQFAADTQLSRAHCSLVLKHAEAWRRALSRGQRTILVLEDDVLLNRNFRAGLATALAAGRGLHDGWLIFLGGADTKVPDAFFLSKTPIFPLPLPTAEGYLTDAAAMARRIAWLDANRVDLPADHLINQIDEACGIGQYWLRSPVVEQGSVFGLFTSKLDRNRLKHSTVYNWLRYHWNKIRRRRLRGCWVKLRARLGG
ncbi:glycosyltransferase family 25 protein [Pandoraea thiooxydans]|uniref:glycosyltransferase family 25 protein n=1 Tax=Pandoraea thiooxydans TaxID=445709 RepID=UPI0009FADDA9|nr:glycosyltransferase family 25 protein [Pandoraea thiooxydans]